MTYSLRQKSGSGDAIFQAQVFILTQFNRKVKSIRLDNETTLTTDIFISKINRLGIQLLPSVPHNQAQNGRSERVGGEIIRSERAISIQNAYLLNRTPRYKFGNKTPFEILYKKQPDIGHNCPIRSKAYYLFKGNSAPPKLQKLNARAAIGYLIGYDGANKFRIWNPARNVIVVTRDVIVDEKTRYEPSDSLTDPLLIRDDTVLENIDEYNLQESTRRHLNELRHEELGDWDIFYDLPIATTLSSAAQTTDKQDDNPSINVGLAIADEQESLKISDTSLAPILTNGSDIESRHIPISEELQTEQSLSQENTIRQIPQRIASRVGEVSADLTEENILPESSRRP
ncbi:hypothetical protein K3495_g6067 [Podosphaera aphanis]|nr:hypothetical protein K3495_g6067 [Podosphaera aphanis]